MITFAQNFFDAEQISTETGTRFYTEAGIFLLEQDINFSVDVFHHIFWNPFNGILFL